MLFKKADKSVNTSFPKSKTVYGIKVNKAPIGRYLEAARGLETLPAAILETLFPGKQAGEILADLTKITNDDLSILIAKAAVMLPEHLIQLMAPILGVDEEKLLNLTPTEFMDVMAAFKEVNDLSRFFMAVSGAVKKLLPTLTVGSKDG